jgi:hypothetical protein
MKYTRSELLGIVAGRHGQPEGQGAGAFIELRMKITPELLEHMLGGYWISADGKRSRFDGVYIDPEGYAEPLLVVEASR